MSRSPEAAEVAIAQRLVGPLDCGFPSSADWAAAPPLRFCTDWRGQNPDLVRETEVRLLWSPKTLYLHFTARFRVVTLFAAAEPSGRRDQLWDRDVAEAFLQPPSSPPGNYKEFEISPNGFWIDLDITPEKRRDLKSRMKHRARIDGQHKIWHGELAIPINSLTLKFDPSQEWRANFYRVEGPAEPRFYSAWRPTMTPQPNFHVPEAFGRLVFAGE